MRAETCEVSIMFKKLLGYSAVSWISALIGLLVMPIISRVFSANDIGQINLLTSSSSILYIIGLFGFDQAYVRFHYDCKEEGQSWGLLTRCLISSLSVTSALIIICVSFKDEIGPLISDVASSGVVVCAISLVVVAQIFLRYTTSYFRVNESLLWFALFTIINTVFTKFGFILGRDARGAFLLLAAEGLLLSLLCLGTLVVSRVREAPSNAKNDEPVARRALLHYGAPLMPAMLLSTVNGYIPVTLLRMHLGFGSAGIYSMIVTLASAVSLVSSGINAFWPPYVFQNYRKKQEAIQSFHRIVVGIVYYLGVVLIGVRSLIPTILGPEYSAATVLFPLLIISPIFYTIGETTGIGLQIAKRSGVYFFINVLGVIANIACAAILIPVFGLIGAGVSTGIAATIVLISKSFVGDRYYNSTGTFRWLISAVSMLWALAILVMYFDGSPVTILFVISFLLVFPLAVGWNNFAVELSRFLSQLSVKDN